MSAAPATAHDLALDHDNGAASLTAVAGVKRGREAVGGADELVAGTGEGSSSSEVGQVKEAAAEEAAGAAAAQPRKRRRLDGPAAELAAFRSRIGQFARDAVLQPALETVDEMLARSLKPTTHMYNAVLSIATRVASPLTPALLSKTLAVFELFIAGTPVPAAAIAPPPAGAAAIAATAATATTAAIAAAISSEASSAATMSPAEAEAALSSLEAAYTSIVRVCVYAGDVARGVEMLRRMLRAGIPPRLRTYTPLLQGLTAGSMTAEQHALAVELFADLLARGLVPQQMDYACVVLAHGKARRDAELAGLLQTMVEAVSHVEEPMVTALRAYFTGHLACDACAPFVSLLPAWGSGTAAAAADASPPPAEAASGEIGDGTAPTATADVAAASSAISTAPAAAASADSAAVEPLLPRHLPLCAHAATVSPPWPWRAAVTTIPTESGVCPVTGTRLRSLQLPEDDYAALLSQVMGLAAQVPEPFAHFCTWLKGRGPFTAIVDGANVGFHHQNFAGGGLMYTQIDAVVRTLQAAGHRVLLVMSKRWLDPARFGNAAARRTRDKKSKKLAHVAWQARQGRDRIAGSGAVPGDDLLGLQVAAAAATAAAARGSGGIDAGAGAVGKAAAASSVGDGGGGGPPRAEAVRASTFGVVMDAAVQAAAAGTGASAPTLHASPARGGGSGSADASEVDGAEGDVDEDGSEGGSSGHSPMNEDWPSTDEEEAAAAAAAVESDAAGVEASRIHVARTIDADTAAAADIVRRWREEDLCYHTLPGTNDDWYWLYAALSQADQSRVIIVSNDFMRDHHFQMLAPTAFLKWRERHQAHYTFTYQPVGPAPTPAGGSTAVAEAEHVVEEGAKPRRRMELLPQLQFPRGYSHRMQSNEAGSVWHFPLAGTVNSWLVAWRADHADGRAAAAGSAC